MSSATKLISASGGAAGDPFWIAKYGVLTSGGNNILHLLDASDPTNLSVATSYNSSADQDYNWSYDNDWLAICDNRSPYITILDHTTRGSLSLAATYALPDDCIACSWSTDGTKLGLAHADAPTGKHFTVVSWNGSSMSLYGNFRFTSASLVAGGKGCGYDPDGDYWAVQGRNPYGTDNLFLLNTTPSGTSLSKADGYDTGSSIPGYLVYNPNGTYFAAINNDVRLFSDTGGTISLSTSYASNTDDLAWSPDGDYLLTGITSSDMTLLDHTTPGSFSVADTYTFSGSPQENKRGGITWGHTDQKWAFVGVGDNSPSGAGVAVFDMSTAGTITYSSFFSMFNDTEVCTKITYPEP